MLNQLKISLSLLFIPSGSTLYLLLTLWLDIAFDVFHTWYARGMNNNYIIKSDVCIKLMYIWIFLDIYQHISYHAESKKKEIKISTMKIN